MSRQETRPSVRIVRGWEGEAFGWEGGGWGRIRWVVLLPSVSPSWRGDVEVELGDGVVVDEEVEGNSVGALW